MRKTFISDRDIGLFIILVPKVFEGVILLKTFISGIDIKLFITLVIKVFEGVILFNIFWGCSFISQ